MERRPEQHRSMAVREHEAITIWPDRIVRVETQDTVPDRIYQRRERHRRAGVPGFGLLNRVDRKRADGVDAQLIKLLVCQMINCLRGAHGRLLPMLCLFRALLLWPGDAGGARLD